MAARWRRMTVCASSQYAFRLFCTARSARQRKTRRGRKRRGKRARTSRMRYLRCNSASCPSTSVGACTQRAFDVSEAMATGGRGERRRARASTAQCRSASRPWCIAGVDRSGNAACAARALVAAPAWPHTHLDTRLPGVARRHGCGRHAGQRPGRGRRDGARQAVRGDSRKQQRPRKGRCGRKTRHRSVQDSPRRPGKAQ
jgi:hypothetical protein